MKERQFLWGLSFGITFLAIAGIFWLGLGVSSIMKSSTNWRWWSLLTFIQCVVLGCTFWATLILRRRSGFTRKDIQLGSEQQRLEGRQIRAKFLRITIGQTALVVLIILLCIRTNMLDQIWPLISLVISLHFIPLSKLFKVGAYSAAGSAGSIMSLVAIIGLLKPYSLFYLGVGMSLVMWFSAVYIFFNADKIVTRAMQDKLSV